MSRLRYNGLATGSSGATAALTLGASLTNSATSVTFSAALTYNNGTAAPTIVAPDYIPLSILDANGNLSEIVYLTAYTAAATTGTITRGQEGTTGVAHSSGDKIVGAPTVQDIANTPTIPASGTTTAYFTTNNPTMVIPSGASVGDLLVAFIGASWNVTSYPTGWRQLGKWEGTNHNGYMIGRVCQSGDPGATTSAFALSGTDTGSILCIAVHGAAAVNDFQGGQNPGGTTVSPTATTRGRAADLAVALVTERGTQNISIASSTTVASRTSDANGRSGIFTVTPDGFPLLPVATTTGSASSAIGFITFSG